MDDRASEANRSCDGNIQPSALAERQFIFVFGLPAPHPFVQHRVRSCAFYVTLVLRRFPRQMSGPFANTSFLTFGGTA